VLLIEGATPSRIIFMLAGHCKLTRKSRDRKRHLNLGLLTLLPNVPLPHLPLLPCRTHHHLTGAVGAGDIVGVHQVLFPSAASRVSYSFPFSFPFFQFSLRPFPPFQAALGGSRVRELDTLLWTKKLDERQVAPLLKCALLTAFG
jgi:hypothetical protein